MAQRSTLCSGSRNTLLSDPNNRGSALQYNVEIDEVNEPLNALVQLPLGQTQQALGAELLAGK